VLWLRISGLALLILGVFSSLFIPMWGRHIALASVALMIVGVTALAVGPRRRRLLNGLSGGVYGDASGVNTDCDAHYHHGGHDGGHGGDGGGGDGGH
jgi:Na+/H+-translocating membrane pyrophosphatase